MNGNKLKYTPAGRELQKALRGAVNLTLQGATIGTTTIGELLTNPGPLHRVVYETRLFDGKKTTVRALFFGIRFKNGLDIYPVPVCLFNHVSNVDTVRETAQYQTAL